MSFITLLKKTKESFCPSNFLFSVVFLFALFSVHLSACFSITQLSLLVPVYLHECYHASLSSPHCMRTDQSKSGHLMNINKQNFWCALRTILVHASATYV